jgi:signal transduction histidine kinase
MFSSTEALSRASHELRTPLNAVLGFAQLLALDELSDSQRHSVEQILAGGRHLLELVEELLDLSRLGADALEVSSSRLEIGDEIAQAVALCRPLAADKSLSLGVEAGPEPVWALADRRRLGQILLNLISNAINYNRPGGSVTLRIGADREDSVRVEVSDTGIGMTQAQLARLFVPFERLDAPRHGIEGNGLGLALSRALADAMGGTIEVVSTPGSGSTFTLVLPPAAPARTGRPAPAEPLAA